MRASNIRPVVLLLPMLILGGAVLASFIDLKAFLAASDAFYQRSLAVTSELFAYAGFFFVVTCLWACFSRLGKVRIGGEGAQPLLSRWAWFSITLCTTVAIGLLFWATAEPLYHLHLPPDPVERPPGSDAAMTFSMASVFMHWSFTPYAIYAVPGLAFALAYYNLRADHSLAGPLAVLLGRRLPALAADLVDAFALLTVAAGMAASLGTGMLSIAGGVGMFTGWATSPLLLAVIALVIVATFVTSAVSGLQRGIRILSDFNTKFFFVFAAFVLIAGPTVELLKLGGYGLVDYAREFVPRSLLLGGEEQREWSQRWTIFYWANWLAWAPLTAVFLGKIARGYTVREFIVVNFALPAAFSVLWMTIFAGSALLQDRAGDGALYVLLTQRGPEAVLYEVLGAFPLGSVLAALILFLSFISYVTSADANTVAISSLCQRSEADKRRGQDLLIKLSWAGLIGMAAWVMTAYSGLDGIRMISNLGGLPALLLVTLFSAALWLMGTWHYGTLVLCKPAVEVMDP